MVVKGSMKSNAKFLTLLLSILVVFAGVACANLAQQVDAIVASQTQGKVRIAVQIINPASGSVIYSRNASTPMIPASNMKVITTAAALKYLGPDFTYQTVVGLSGDSLVVIGSGDPLLGDKPTSEKHSVSPRWVLYDIAEQLRKNNVAAVSDIIIDSSVFDDEHVHPHWPKKELNKRYACEISGLNYNDNCIDITAETAGPKVQLTIDPQTAYVQIINKCTPTNKPPDTVGALDLPAQMSLPFSAPVIKPASRSTSQSTGHLRFSGFSYPKSWHVTAFPFGADSSKERCCPLNRSNHLRYIALPCGMFLTAATRTVWVWPPNHY